MRVSNQMMNQMLSSGIQSNQSAVYAQEQQISSGKRINRASDDPTAWAQSARLEQQKSELAGYAKTAEAASGRLLYMDQSLASITEILQGASELSVRGSDSTLSAVNRNVLAEQVDQLLEDLVMVSNSKYAAEYQFGGADTQTEPFAATRNADGRIDAVSYSGSGFSSMVEIAPGDSLPRQLVGGGADNGILISDTGDAFNVLIRMRDDLLAGKNLAESTAQSEIDAIADEVLVDRASVGAFIEHAEFVSEMHSAKELVLAEHISGLQDIDVAEAVTELAAKQTAYEAALNMASKTLNMSLLKYI